MIPTNPLKLYVSYKLESGYAETSTKRRPREPETVVVGEEEIASCRCVGSANMGDGNPSWLAFRHRRTGRYYFQLHPW